MDDISLSYYDDPRNGLSIVPQGGYVVRNPGAQPPRLAPPRAFPPPLLTRGPGFAYPAAPVMQPAPVMYPQPVYGYPTTPGMRRSLRDFSVSELLPVLALGFAALRPLPDAPPIAPGDTGIAPNVANQSRYLASLATHAHSDLQLVAIANGIAKLLGGAQ